MCMCLYMAYKEYLLYVLVPVHGLYRVPYVCACACTWLIKSTLCMCLCLYMAYIEYLMYVHVPVHGLYRVPYVCACACTWLI